jgi:hypothetical protein
MQRNQAQAVIETLEGRVMFAGTALSVVEAGVAGGIELRITGTSKADNITVKQTAAGLVVGNTGGWTKTFTKGYKGIKVDGAAGNDKITLDASVTTKAVLYGGAGNDVIVGGSAADQVYGGEGTDTLSGGAGDDVIVSVGDGAMDKLNGGAGRDSFWADNAAKEKVADLSGEEKANGSMHRVSGFVNQKNAPAGKTGKSSKASKTASAAKVNLADPAVTDSTIGYRSYAGNPLFSDAGPVAGDVRQGSVGDCFYLAVLASVAKVDPAHIRESVVDLGDGTYAVQFDTGGGKAFVRVDADLPTWSDGMLAYANLGAQNSMWVAVMEKAYAFFRTGAGSYASIDGGWMTESYSAVGVKHKSIEAQPSGQALLKLLQAELAAGRSVTYAVGDVSQGANLVAYHAYSVESVGLDADGKPATLRLRNPWAVDGETCTDGVNDGVVTITAAQAAACFLGVVSAAV